MDRTCEICGGSLPIMARSHARTCSSRCRKALSRRHSIPAALRERPRWVRHDDQKRPLMVRHKGYASSTASDTWATYGEARECDKGVGVGFVLNGDGICCIDLDHCLDGESLADWARDILDACPTTYVEVSPSGSGLHIWGYGTVGTGRRVRDGRNVEFYDRGRYIAVTGNRYGTTGSLADLSEVLATLT